MAIPLRPRCGRSSASVRPIRPKTATSRRTTTTRSRRSPPMQRNLTIAFGLAVVALAAVLAVRSLPPRANDSASAIDSGTLPDAANDAAGSTAVDAAGETPGASGDDDIGDDSKTTVDAGELRL